MLSEDGTIILVSVSVMTAYETLRTVQASQLQYLYQDNQQRSKVELFERYSSQNDNPPVLLGSYH